MCQVTKILDVFQNHRMQPTDKDQFEQVGKKILEDKLVSFVSSQSPIEFAMLGFPFKSKNKRDKVLGDKPDMAEEATLFNFANFNKEIQGIYKPGAIFNIISDGLIFNDLMDIEDRIAYQYREISEDMGNTANAPIKWYSLDDFYSHISLKEKREKVIEQFGITDEYMERQILFDANTHYLYLGMLKFMGEEFAYKDFASGKQMKREVKALVRKLMFRNEAYSNLVRKEFASKIRLSMHPSVNDGTKYSIKLLPGDNTKHSAWHSVAVLNGEEIMTLHRKDAEELGYQLVTKDNQPYYYTV